MELLLILLFAWMILIFGLVAIAIAVILSPFWFAWKYLEFLFLGIVATLSKFFKEKKILLSFTSHCIGFVGIWLLWFKKISLSAHAHTFLVVLLIVYLITTFIWAGINIKYFERPL